jgi:phage tail sheath gpL-like
MPISFNEIPSNWRQPLYWVEVDGSMAGFPVSHMRSLLVGIMMTTGGASHTATAAAVAAGGTGYAINNTITLADGVQLTVTNVAAGAITSVTLTSGGNAPTPPPNPMAQQSTSGSGTGATFNVTWASTSANGTATPDVPIICGRQMDADHLFGQGSELSVMFHSFFANNWGNEVWALPVAEPPASVKAHGTITVTAPPTEAGTIDLFIAGIHVPVNIPATAIVNDVATSIADMINDPLYQNRGMPVTATASAAIVTLTCKWGGKNGDQITMTDSYYGKIGGELLPLGVVLTYSGFNLTGGVGIPDFSNAIANMGETEFEYVALPYTDSTSLVAWEDEYGFGDTGRWGWMRQHFGHLFGAMKDTYSGLVNWGLTRNGRVLSVLGIEPESPSPEFAWCAAYAAKAARALINDPARPLQTLHLESILPCHKEDLFNIPERNTLAYSGIATQATIVQSDGPMIMRETTTYQVNAYGFGDDAFELVTTLATLAKLIRNQRYAITTKYPRHKLADDDTRFGPGQAIVTPKIIKAELVSQYALDMWNGLVENMTAFKAHLIVERDPNDPNRMNVLYPPDLINQLRVFAVLAQFRLQYNRGIDSAIIGDSTVLTGTAPPPAA